MDLVSMVILVNMLKDNISDIWVWLQKVVDLELTRETSRYKYASDLYTLLSGIVSAPDYSWIPWPLLLHVDIRESIIIIIIIIVIIILIIISPF